MSEILSRESVVALPETFGIEQKEGKNPQVVGKVRVVDGPTAGREQILYMSLAEGQAQEITVRQLRALGWACNDITALSGLGSIKADMTSKMGKPSADGKYAAKLQYTIWEQKPRPTLRAEDQAIFKARFMALAASTPLVAVTDETKAPETLPAAVQHTAAPAVSNGASAAVTALFE